MTHYGYPQPTSLPHITDLYQGPQETPILPPLNQNPQSIHASQQLPYPHNSINSQQHNANLNASMGGYAHHGLPPVYPIPSYNNQSTVQPANTQEASSFDSTHQQNARSERPNGRLVPVVGSQGRRGILPSATGRAPEVGSTPNGASPGGINTTKNADGKFACNHCPRTYLHQKHLKRHHLRHTGERPYQCSLCNDTFCRSDILKRHWNKCSQRRGAPVGSTHLTNAQAHLRKRRTSSSTTSPSMTEVASGTSQLHNRNAWTTNSQIQFPNRSSEQGSTTGGMDQPLDSGRSSRSSSIPQSTNDFNDDRRRGSEIQEPNNSASNLNMNPTQSNYNMQPEQTYSNYDYNHPVPQYSSNGQYAGYYIPQYGPQLSSAPPNSSFTSQAELPHHISDFPRDIDNGAYRNQWGSVAQYGVANQQRRSNTNVQTPNRPPQGQYGTYFQPGVQDSMIYPGH